MSAPRIARRAFIDACSECGLTASLLRCKKHPIWLVTRPDGATTRIVDAGTPGRHNRGHQNTLARLKAFARGDIE
jgi:hypothetical protein